MFEMPHKIATGERFMHKILTLASKRNYYNVRIENKIYQLIINYRSEDDLYFCEIYDLSKIPAPCTENRKALFLVDGKENISEHFDPPDEILITEVIALCDETAQENVPPAHPANIDEQLVAKRRQTRQNIGLISIATIAGSSLGILGLNFHYSEKEQATEPKTKMPLDENTRQKILNHFQQSYCSSENSHLQGSQFLSMKIDQFTAYKVISGEMQIGKQRIKAGQIIVYNNETGDSVILEQINQKH